MKHTTEELLFTLQLRQLVMTRMTDQAPMDSSSPAYAKWREDNAYKYFKEAIDELDMLADVIKEIREAKAQ